MFRVGVAVIVVGLVTLMASGDAVAQGEKPPGVKRTHLKVGQQAPAFTFTDLDGKERALLDFRGRIVLIDFVWWTAGNIAVGSLGEIPALRETQQRFCGKRFAIIGISMDTKPDSVRSVMAREDLAFPVYVHQTGFAGEICKLYGVQRCPMNFLLDREGRIVRINVPAEELVEVVGGLLAKAPPDPEIPAAYNLLSQGNVEAAMVKALREVHDDPTNPRAFTLLGDCYVAARRPRQALAAYSAAAERLDRYDPPELIAHVCTRSALLWHRAGDANKTSAALERGLKIIEDPRYRLQILYDVGGVYATSERLKLAKERYVAFLREYAKADEAVQTHYEKKRENVKQRLAQVRAMIAAQAEQKAADDKKE